MVVEGEQLAVEIGVERHWTVAQEYHASARLFGADSDGVDGRRLELDEIDVAALGRRAREIGLELAAAGQRGRGHDRIGAGHARLARAEQRHAGIVRRLLDRLGNELASERRAEALADRP